ncbi:MAG: ribokinase [Candidatus Obscuribacterales bacterium]
MASSIVVVGSLSLDMVFKVDRRPGKGETIKGKSFETFVGGKGNNQALAAALCGGNVAMVGRVGDDTYGQTIMDTLESTGVEISHLMASPEFGTGLANIYIDPDGDNSIVIVPRANDTLTPEFVDEASDLIKLASLILLQLEIPLETVLHAARMGRELGKTVMLNPAPAPPEGKLPEGLLELLDYLLPNQSEAELLTGIKVTDRESAFKAAAALKETCPGAVLITMGEHGVCGLDADGTEVSQESFTVEVVDTTAAGDAFCGALAARLVEGDSLQTSLRFACAAGALATTKEGAVPSLPLQTEVEELLFVKA